MKINGKMNKLQVVLKMKKKKSFWFYNFLKTEKKISNEFEITKNGFVMCLVVTMSRVYQKIRSISFAPAHK